MDTLKEVKRSKIRKRRNEVLDSPKDDVGKKIKLDSDVEQISSGSSIAKQDGGNECNVNAVTAGPSSAIRGRDDQPETNVADSDEVDIKPGSKTSCESMEVEVAASSSVSSEEPSHHQPLHGTNLVSTSTSSEASQVLEELKKSPEDSRKMNEKSQRLVKQLEDPAFAQMSQNEQFESTTMSRGNTSLGNPETDLNMDVQLPPEDACKLSQSLSENEQMKERVRRLESRMEKLGNLHDVKNSSTEGSETVPTQVSTTDNRSKKSATLTRKEKVLLLFGDVVKILLKQDVWHDEADSDIMMKLNPRHVDWASRLPILKNCRLVCKAWRDSIDNVLVKERSLLLLIYDICWYFSCQIVDLRKRYSPAPVALNFCTNIESGSGNGNNRIENFLASFESIQKEDPFYNPIKTRHLEINLRHEPVNQGSTECKSNSPEVFKFLRAVGNHVWHLTGPRGEKWNDELDGLHRLQSKWLKLLPNLRSLCIDIRLGVGNEGESSKNEHFSIPRLEHLETVILLQPVACPFLSQLLRSNNHIKRLQFGLASADKVDQLVILLCEIPLPNLTELSIIFTNDLQWIQLASSTTWALTSLGLTFIHEVSVEHVFFHTEKFDNTLEFLRLELGDISLNFGQLSLNLPNLLHLQLETQLKSKLRWNSLFKRLDSLETLKVSIEADCLRENEKDMLQDCINCAVDKGNWCSLRKLTLVTVIVQDDCTDNLSYVFRRRCFQRSDGMNPFKFKLCMESNLFALLNSPVASRPNGEELNLSNLKECLREI